MEISESKIVTIKYKNYKGAIGDRKIQPVEIWFGKTIYHPEEQWLLKAFDIAKNEFRHFSVLDIISWNVNKE